MLNGCLYESYEYCNSEAGRFIRIKTRASLDLRCKYMLIKREIVPMGSEY